MYEFAKGIDEKSVRYEADVDGALQLIAFIAEFNPLVLLRRLPSVPGSGGTHPENAQGASA